MERGPEYYIISFFVLLVSYIFWLMSVVRNPRQCVCVLPALLQKAMVISNSNLDFWYKKKLVISSPLQNTLRTKEHVPFSKGSPISVCVSVAAS